MSIEYLVAYTTLTGRPLHQHPEYSTSPPRHIAFQAEEAKRECECEQVQGQAHQG